MLATDDRRMLNVAISHLTAIVDGSAAQHGADRMRAGIALDALLAIVDRPAPGPTYCEIHQHTKWCKHNGGVMGATGWEAPAPGLDLDAAEKRAAGFRGVFRVMAYDSGDEMLEYIDAGADHTDLDTDDVHEIAQFACDDAVQRAIVETMNAAPELIAEVRALRSSLAEAKRLGREFAEMCASHKDTAEMLAVLEAL